MRRDLRGELLAALLLVLLLAVVGLSAFLLSLVSSEPDATGTVVAGGGTVTLGTPTALVDSTRVTATPLRQTSTSTPSATNTGTPIESPSATNTETATATVTPSPTETETNTVTATEQATTTPTLTRTATATEEPTAVAMVVTHTATVTRTATRTATAVATETATDIPIITATRPAAPGAPTATVIGIVTATRAAPLMPMSSATGVRIVTSTTRPVMAPVDSTATAVPTVTATPRLTIIAPQMATPIPIVTATRLASLAPPPSPMIGATVAAAHPPVPAPCAIPPGWTTYTVQPGNTLYSIARAVGSTVGELREVNCIADASNIDVEQVLFVPRAPNGPVQTGVPRPPDVDDMFGLLPEGCTVPASSIVFPAPGERLNGVFPVFGTAALEDFQYYKLEVRPDFTNVYNFYGRADIPVLNGPLGIINTDLFGDGVYWVRVVVVDKTGNFVEPCAIPVIFE